MEDIPFFDLEEDDSDESTAEELPSETLIVKKIKKSSVLLRSSKARLGLPEPKKLSPPNSDPLAPEPSPKTLEYALDSFYSEGSLDIDRESGQSIIGFLSKRSHRERALVLDRTGILRTAHKILPCKRGH